MHGRPGTWEHLLPAWKDQEEGTKPPSPLPQVCFSFPPCPPLALCKRWGPVHLAHPTLFWPPFSLRDMNNQEATFFRPHVISPSAATCPVSPSPVTQSCNLACVTTLPLLQTGTLRYRQVTGVVLNPRKPGRPSQRATGIFVKTSLAHHALAWSNNGPVDGAQMACTVPILQKAELGFREGEPPA